MAPAPKYTVTKKNLHIDKDMAFVNNLLKSIKIDAEPDARGLLVDIMYTLVRDSLLQAKRFTKLTIRPKINAEDIRMKRSFAVPQAVKRSKPKPSAEAILRQLQPMHFSNVAANRKLGSTGTSNSVTLTKANPAKVTKPNSVKVTKANPVKVTKPNPVKVTKANPVKVTKANPVKATKANPVKVTKPKTTKTKRTNQKTNQNKLK